MFWASETSVEWRLDVFVFDLLLNLPTPMRVSDFYLPTQKSDSDCHNGIYEIMDLSAVLQLPKSQLSLIEAAVFQSVHKAWVATMTMAVE